MRFPEFLISSETTYEYQTSAGHTCGCLPVILAHRTSPRMLSREHRSGRVRHNRCTMVRQAKLLARARNNPRYVRFSDLLLLVETVGFVFKRQVGSHRQYWHPEARVALNLQPDKHGRPSPWGEDDAWWRQPDQQSPYNGPVGFRAAWSEGEMETDRL